MLITAASGDGQIWYLKSFDGVQIKANNQVINDSDDPRDRARWKAAIDELVDFYFVEERGEKGQLFELTLEAYKYVDSIES